MRKDGDGDGDGDGERMVMMRRRCLVGFVVMLTICGDGLDW